MTVAPKPIPAQRGDRRRQRTRSAIIGAGQRLFAARAIEGVTIDDIVAEADVAKGSFYNHFDDKQELADAILALVHGDCEFHILAANRAVDDPAARVARALCVMMVYAAEHPDRLQALLSLSERRRDADSPLNAGIASDIADGLVKRRFVGVEVETGLLVATALIAVAVVQVIAGTVAGSPRDLADTIGAALLRALGVMPAEADDLARAASADLLAGPLPR